MAQIIFTDFVKKKLSYHRVSMCQLYEEP